VNKIQDLVPAQRPGGTGKRKEAQAPLKVRIRTGQIKKKTESKDIGLFDLSLWWRFARVRAVSGPTKERKRHRDLARNRTHAHALLTRW